MGWIWIFGPAACGLAMATSPRRHSTPSRPPTSSFWGLIDPRLDLAFLRELSASLTEGTIVLIGPEDRPDPELYRLPRVIRRPAVSLSELPAIAAATSVLVMPYADLPVTRAMQPLKLTEYLATGKPAVVRDLPATRPWADALDVAGRRQNSPRRSIGGSRAGCRTPSEPPAPPGC